MFLRQFKNSVSTNLTIFDARYHRWLWTSSFSSQ